MCRHVRMYICMCEGECMCRYIDRPVSVLQMLFSRSFLFVIILTSDVLTFIYFMMKYCKHNR
jgi:hypothetical protein